jgi:hypothetical protein
MRSTAPVLVLVLLLVIVTINAAQTPTKQNHVTQPADISDSLKLKIRDEQVAQLKMQTEYQGLQKQIDDSPIGKRMAELGKSFQESIDKMKVLTKEACGDEAKFQINLDSLKCEPKPAPSPSPKS